MGKCDLPLEFPCPFLGSLFFELHRLWDLKLDAPLSGGNGPAVIRRRPLAAAGEKETPVHPDEDRQEMMARIHG